MSFDWTTKEKIVLISNVLEHGDQSESWSSISKDLSKTFPTHLIPSQAKRDGRYSIKNCKQAYQYLVNRYQSQWTEHGTANGLKLPLAKYIWAQLKSIYQAELTQQLNESRKKLTEFCLRLESALHSRNSTNDSTIIPVTTMETTMPVINHKENELKDENTPLPEVVFQPIKLESEIPPSESVQSILPSESSFVNTTMDNSKEQTRVPTPNITDESQLKQEIRTDNSEETASNQIDSIMAFSSSPSTKQSRPILEEDISQQTSVESPQNISYDQQSVLGQTINSVTQSALTSNVATRSESISSSRSTSRTSSETKTEVTKNIPAATITTKYHVYFSPKNTNNNQASGHKMKSKRRTTDDVKDEIESESTNQSDPASSSSNPDTTKPTSSTAPMTRRSVNTRSAPNSAAEQEEEKSRRFSVMLAENPNSWQSQSMAIIQFILAHKQGYLFEHEITDEIAPKYHQYIRRPIALDTIRKTLESNAYQTKEYFKRDVYLMFYNAMKYNPRYHHVHRSAKHLFNITVSLFDLAASEIQGRIVTKSSSSLTSTTNDIPSAKRKRIQ